MLATREKQELVREKQKEINLFQKEIENKFKEVWIPPKKEVKECVENKKNEKKKYTWLEHHTLKIDILSEYDYETSFERFKNELMEIVNSNIAKKANILVWRFPPTLFSEKLFDDPSYQGSFRARFTIGIESNLIGE